MLYEEAYDIAQLTLWLELVLEKLGNSEGETIGKP